MTSKNEGLASTLKAVRRIAGSRKAPKEKWECQEFHAQKRLLERYSLRMTLNEIRGLGNVIRGRRKGTFETIQKDYTLGGIYHAGVYKVTWGSWKLILVYDRQTRSVVTFLKPEWVKEKL